MPRGIGYNCTQSPPIQSLHPPYWAELEMSASVTGVERAVTKAGSSMAGGVKLPMVGLLHPGPSSSMAGPRSSSASALGAAVGIGEFLDVYIQIGIGI